MLDLTVEHNEGIATVWLDGPQGIRFDLESLRRLTKILQPLINHTDVQILILKSRHPEGFSSGWHPEIALRSICETESLQLASLGQKLCQQIAEARCYTVADLHSDCLGPGFELALACDFRIAEATIHSRLGFPDATVGLLPTWGGIRRLISRLGSKATSRWLANPKIINARQAKSIGLVDRVFTSQRGKIERRLFVDWLHQLKRKPPISSWLARGRHAIRVLRSIPARYSPFQLTIDAIIRSSQASPGEGHAAERTWFARAMESERVRSHFAIEQSNLAEPRLPTYPTLPISPTPKVVGLGVGDASLAMITALAGLKGSRVECYSDAAEAFRSSLSSFVHQAIATRDEIDAVLQRTTIVKNIDWDGAQIDWLLTSASQHMWQSEALPSRAVISINSELIEPHQTDSPRASRVIGMRYDPFWPLPGSQPICEIAMGPETSSHTAATLARWLKTLGIKGIIGADRNGLTIRRVLSAYFDEAVRLVAEGISPLALDAVVRTSGSVEGPFERMDRIGFEGLIGGVRRLMPLLACGMTGQEQGFYCKSLWGRRKENVSAQLLLWDSRMNAVDAIHQSPAAIDLLEPKQQLVVAIERLGLRTLNEAIGCLYDDGVSGPKEIDLAITRGAGLLVNQGGPMRHADRIGIPMMASRLAGMAKLYGPRFKPHPDLLRRATANATFYDHYDDVELVVRQLKAA